MLAAHTHAHATHAHGPTRRRAAAARPEGGRKPHEGIEPETTPAGRARARGEAGPPRA